MAFGIPLDNKEKWYIAQFPELSHGDCARSLNRLFKRINKGTRSRNGVYEFRATQEYKELRKKAEEKEQKLRQNKQTDSFNPPVSVLSK